MTTSPTPGPEKRWAPWTPEEVENLSDFQRHPLFHPWTCGVDSAHPPLLATASGWQCVACPYRQAWAMARLADGAWRGPASVIERFIRDVRPGEKN